MAAGDLRAARLDAEAAAALDPRADHRAIAVLTQALEGSAVEQVMALQTLDRLVRDAGASVRPLRCRALLLRRLGRTREARRDFEAVLKSEPHDVTAGKALAELAQDGPKRPRR